MDSEFFLLDVNVLIALAWPQHVHHVRADTWFDSLDSPWATTPVTESAFLRLSTNAKVVGAQVPMEQALRMLEAIRGTPDHRFLPDSTSFATPVLSLANLVTPAQVTDMHLVQIAAASGGALATLDRGIEHLVVEADRHYVLVIP